MRKIIARRRRINTTFHKRDKYLLNTRSSISFSRKGDSQRDVVRIKSCKKKKNRRKQRKKGKENFIFSLKSVRGRGRAFYHPETSFSAINPRECKSNGGSTVKCTVNLDRTWIDSSQRGEDTTPKRAAATPPPSVPRSRPSLHANGLPRLSIAIRMISMARGRAKRTNTKTSG